jgi:hypothetical protein
LLHNFKINNVYGVIEESNQGQPVKFKNYSEFEDWAKQGTSSIKVYEYELKSVEEAMEYCKKLKLPYGGVIDREYIIEIDIPI